jgi:formylmethanofuran dehydrogenase subunit E
MVKHYLDAELEEAKKFHGHLGPYLVIGMRMGHFIASVFGNRPFSYRITASVGWKPPPSCVIDGLQITTPCTVGNSMLKIESLSDVKVWADKDGERLEILLKPPLRRSIDRETTRENEEKAAEDLWRQGAEDLFVIRQFPL